MDATAPENLTMDAEDVKKLSEHYGVSEDSVRYLDRRFATIYAQRLEVWKQVELSKISEEQDAKIKISVKEYLDKLEAERKPLEPADIQKLVNQDYVEVPVQLPGRDGKKRSFTISELPSEAEETFYSRFQKVFQDRASDVAALAQETMDQPMDVKIKSFLTIFGDSFDMLAEAVVLILNYDGAHEEITVDWVKKNISSYRQWNIVRAQIEANKLRDFFSELFQSGTRTMTMTTGLNAQQLQQLQVK